MRFWIAFASIVLVVGFLFYRLSALDDRIDRLWVAVDGKTAQDGSSILGQGGNSLAQTDVEHEARFDNIERRLDALQQQLASLKQRPAPDAQPPKRAKNEPTEEPSRGEPDSPADLGMLTSKQAEERILSVIEEEAKRIRDKQLAWHRDKVVRDRLKGLEQFAEEQQLSEHQREELETLLVEEVDRMVEIFRNPDAAHPDAIIERFASLRSETNEEARMLLDEQQFEAYKAARELERDRWLPWLPKQDEAGP